MTGLILGRLGTAQRNATDWSKMKSFADYLLSIQQVCKITGYERHTIYRYIESGKLKAVRPAKRSHWRVFKSDLYKFLKATEDEQIEALDKILKGEHL